MKGCYLCSPTNSTLFTRCCDVAITEQQNRCPSCGTEIEPMPARWSNAFRNSMSAAQHKEHVARVSKKIKEDVLRAQKEGE